MTLREKVEQYMKSPEWKGGICYQLPECTSDELDILLMQKTMEALDQLMKIQRNLNLRYIWKRETGFPCFFLVACDTPIGYYAVGLCMGDVYHQFPEIINVTHGRNNK